MKKTTSFLLTVTIGASLFSPAVYASSKPVYTTNNLFDFNSATEQSKQYTNQFSQEQQQSAPISTIISAEQNASDRYIIKTKKVLSVDEQKKLLGKLGSYSQNLKAAIGFSAYIPKDNVEELKKDPLVSAVFVDSVVIGLGETPSIGIKSSSVPQVWDEKHITGTGIGVAVLDTGVFSHEDLIKPNNRIVAFKDFVNQKTYPYDDSGHGTHVAGIIAGNGNYSADKYVGAAPDVQLIVGKVLDSNERGNVSTVIEGIDWVIENKSKYNIQVLNLSLGTNFTSDSDPLIQAVDKAWDAGIVVVTAAGNGGSYAKVMSPAASKKVIAVGGTDTHNTIDPSDDDIAWFSVQPQQINGVSKPEIYAPGTDVVSLLSPGSTFYKTNASQIVDGLYYKMSGTSMSAPIVAGSIALMLENNSSLSPDQVKTKVVSNSITHDGIHIFNLAKSMGLTPTFVESQDSTQTVIPPVVTTPEPSTTPEPTQPPVTTVPDSNPSQGQSSTDSGTSTTTTSPDLGTTKTDVTTQVPPSEIKTEEGSDGYTPSSEPSFADTRPVVSVPQSPTYKEDGFQFVKDTYSTKDILQLLVQNSDDYKNGKTVEEQYANISDIIKLFNLINRSFTREDFLYFEQRLKQ